MIVVIDCNIFVMCITSNSPYHHIYKSLIERKFDLVITTDILLEYEEIIERKYNRSTAQLFITLLNELPNVHFINYYYRWQLIKSDPDDDKYCDCAIAGKADHIVTQDNHFDVLKDIKFPSLNILSISSFVNMLK